MGNYWHTYCGSYNKTNFTRNSDAIPYGMITSETTTTCNINVPALDECYDVAFPTVSAGKRNLFKIGEGMSVTFNLGSDTKFGDYDGYNGMVSFCWYSCKGSVNFASNEVTAIPKYAIDSFYDKYYTTNSSDPSDWGGLSERLYDINDSDRIGFVLTLFPDQGIGDYGHTALHEGTRCVSAFKLCVITSNNKCRTIEGYLPKTIDLSCDTTISVHNVFEEYHICINGIELYGKIRYDDYLEETVGKSVSATVPNSFGGEFEKLGESSNCRFAMCVMGGYESGADLNITNFSTET